MRDEEILNIPENPRSPLYSPSRSSNPFSLLRLLGEPAEADGEFDAPLTMVAPGDRQDDAPGGELSLPCVPSGFAVGLLHGPVLGVGLQELFDGAGSPPHYHLEPLLLEAFPDPGLPADATADVLPGVSPGRRSSRSV